MKHTWNEFATVTAKGSLVIAAILPLSLFPTRAPAATITITNFGDNGPGTLREALASAAAGDTIVIPGGLSPAIALTSGELLITRDVAIVGPGPGQMAVSGNLNSRIFHIAPSKIVSISGLTITNGAATTSYPETNAGALFNDHATLTVSNCTISGNLSGGIVNRAGFDGATFGPAATLVLVNSLITGNSGPDAGGLSSSSGQGGPATVTISNCIISGNSGSFVGGIGNFDAGWGFDSATMQISSSTISGNSGGYGVGGVANTAQEGCTPSLTLTGCTVSGNSAYGPAGIDNYGPAGSRVTLNINNCTFSSNSCDGAGIVNNYASGPGTVTTKVSNTTFSGNVVTNQNGGFAGIIYNDVTGGGTATVQIGNTILNVGRAGKSIFNYPGGIITSFGYNLSSDAAGGNTATGPGGLLNAIGDQRNTNPRLGPLQDNGGPTATHALLSGSPALDKGKRDTIPELAATTDQRGWSRPFVNLGIPSTTGGDGSDVGAYELTPPRLSVARQGSQLLFFWPTNNGGFRMQSSTSLVSSNGWTTPAGVTATLGEWYYFTNAVPTGNTFYRLILSQ